MKEHTWAPASLLALFSLICGPAVHAACSTTMPLPSCIDTVPLDKNPRFDLQSACDYAVTINATASVVGANLDFTFNLGQGETMSSLILSEIPSDELEILTNAHLDGILSLTCCPDFSRFTQCQTEAE